MCLKVVILLLHCREKVKKGTHKPRKQEATTSLTDSHLTTQRSLQVQRHNLGGIAMILTPSPSLIPLYMTHDICYKPKMIH